MLLCLLGEAFDLEAASAVELGLLLEGSGVSTGVRLLEEEEDESEVRVVLRVTLEASLRSFSGNEEKEGEGEGEAKEEAWEDIKGVKGQDGSGRTVGAPSRSEMHDSRRLVSNRMVVCEWS